MLHNSQKMEDELDLDLDELDIKPLIFRYPCLVCTGNDESENESANNVEQGWLINGSTEDNEQIFTLLCKSLGIKLPKKYSWDFNQEQLPFCSSCSELTRELVQIRDQIRLLESESRNKVQNIRNLITRSESRNNFEAAGTNDLDEEKYFEKFVCFRKQIHRVKVSSKESIINRRSGRVAQRTQNIVTKTKTEVPIPEWQDDQEIELQQDDLDEQIEFEYPCGIGKEENEAESRALLDNVAVEPLDIEYESRFEITSAEPNTSESIPSAKRSFNKANATKPKGAKRKKRSSTSDDSSVDDGDSDFRLEDSDTSSGCDEEYMYTHTGKLDGNNLWLRSKDGTTVYRGISVIRLDNGFKCTKCGFVVEGGVRIDQPQKIKYHIDVTHRHNPLESVCRICDKKLASKKNLDIHVKGVHGNSTLILCRICEKPFTTRIGMERHAWSHKNEEEIQAAIASGKSQSNPKRKEPSLLCNTCGKLFVEYRQLKYHEATHLDKSERSKFNCPTCGVTFTSEAGLKSHIKLKHTDPSQIHFHHCPHCPKKWEVASKLKAHMVIHTGKKPHLCARCGSGAGCRTKALLKVHMNMHDDIRPFKCEADGCEMAFFMRYHLRRHREVYHNKNRPPPARKQSYRSRDGTRKPYIRKKSQTRTRDCNGEAGVSENVDHAEIARSEIIKPLTPSLDKHLETLYNSNMDHWI